MILPTCRLSKWQLMQAMFQSIALGIVTVHGSDYVLKGVQREDGSGDCFNLALSRQGKDFTVFCRTTD